MFRRRPSKWAAWTLVVIVVFGPGGLLGSAGCNGDDDDRTTFRDAFNTFGDAFSDWIDKVF